MLGIEAKEKGKGLVYSKSLICVATSRGGLRTPSQKNAKTRRVPERTNDPETHRVIETFLRFLTSQ